MKQLALSAIIAAVLFGGLASQAHANQLDAVLVPDKDMTLAEFAGQRVININYPQASDLAKTYKGKDIMIDFTVQGNKTAPVVQAVNSALLAKGKR